MENIHAKLGAGVSSLCLFLAIGLATLSATLSNASEMPTNQLRTMQLVEIPQAARLQRAGDSLFQCTTEHSAAYHGAHLPTGDGLSVIAEIRRKLDRQFTYREDRLEAWSDLTGDVVAGRQVVGDCEDYAATVITMALCAGIPASKLGFAMSSSKGNQASVDRVDHALGLYLSDSGVEVIADTSNRRIRAYRKERDKIVFWQTVDELVEHPGVYRVEIALDGDRPSRSPTDARAER